ncbi:MAG: hypothetical protein GX442_11490 [Candidatus Riflebacteria bacterium]|nr:hypothetical protein [Candidatus Riflebacteria bacterium]
MGFLIFLLTLAASPQLPGCDENLLAALRPHLPAAGAARNLFNLAGQTDQLADSLGSLPSARTAFARLESEWLQVERNWQRDGADPSPRLRAGLAAALLGLRFSLAREDLVAAHEDTERVFFATIGLLRADGLPPPQESLLEVALGIEALLDEAQAKRLAESGPRIAALIPALQQVREAFPGVATLPATNLVDLATSLAQVDPAQGTGGEKIQVGIALMKQEFSVFLRVLAAHLASNQEAR